MIALTITVAVITFLVGCALRFRQWVHHDMMNDPD